MRFEIDELWTLLAVVDKVHSIYHFSAPSLSPSLDQEKEAVKKTMPKEERTQKSISK